MEPISTALAGFALFKSAVDGIKSVISTANDVSEIAGHIDNLFEGERQVQQRRNKKSGVGVGDQFGIKSVAQEIIDAKLAKEQAAAERRKKIQEDKAFEEMMQQILLIGAVIVVSLGLFVMLFTVVL